MVAVCADFQTGFNLIVCYYALGDEEKMRKGFSRLLSIPMPHSTEEEVRQIPNCSIGICWVVVFVFVVLCVCD